MFWKIIGTALCSYLLFKGIGMMMLSISFLIDGELARYSSVFRDRFTKRYFIKSDTVNLLMNFSLCLWCVICLLEIWNIFIFNETFLVFCLVLGILISMFSFNINYTIADVLHGMVTNFKVIVLPALLIGTDLCMDDSGVRDSNQQSKQKNAQTLGRFFCQNACNIATMPIMSGR